MGKKPAKVANLQIGGVQLEPYAKNIGMDITQEVPNVTAISDAGPRVVVGNYDVKFSLDGEADFGTGLSDATIAGMLGSTALHAVSFDPTGTTAGPDDPNYDFTDAVLASYSIKAAVGAAVVYNAGFQANSSMTRSTTS